MTEGYDGGDLLQIAEQYIPSGASVLELGMGPGKDLERLSEKYVITGSDSSQAFLELYMENHPDADLLQLDAVTIETGRRFDVIYSNKVLMHLSKEELISSFQRQIEVVNPGGILFHTFWSGKGEQYIEDLRFVYYTGDALLQLIARVLPKHEYEVLAAESYAEEEENDSFYLVLRKSA